VRAQPVEVDHRSTDRYFADSGCTETDTPDRTTTDKGITGQLPAPGACRYAGPKGGLVMRYLVQFIVPALIFVGVVYLLARRRREAARASEQQAASGGSDTGAFLVILALGAAVAIVIALVMQSFWS